MRNKMDLVSIVEMQRYADSFFSHQLRTEQKLGKIGWVLHCGYENVVAKQPASIGSDLSPLISFLSAFILPKKEIHSNNAIRELCWQDFTDLRYDRYMSEADRRVVREIQTHGNAPEPFSLHFPATYETLRLLCNHPNLYLSRLDFIRNGIRNNMLNRIVSRTEAITLDLKEPAVLVNEIDGLLYEVQVENCSELPEIYRDRRGCFCIYSDTDKSRQLRRFIDDVGFGGKLYVSVEQTDLLGRFLNIFNAGDKKECFMDSRSNSAPPFMRMSVRMFTRNGQIGGAMRVHLSLRGDEATEPGKGEKRWRDKPNAHHFVERDFERELAQRSAVLAKCPTLAAVLGKDKNDWLLPVGATALNIIDELSQCTPELVSVDWEWIADEIKVQRKRVQMTLSIWDGPLMNKHQWVGMRIQAEDTHKMQLFRELFRRLRKEKQEFLQNEKGEFSLISTPLYLLSRLSQLQKSDCDNDSADMFLSISRAGLLLMALATLNKPDDDELKGLSDLTAPVLQQFQASVSPPEGVQGNLRPYQLAGYEWMQHLLNCGCGACLADDMGLGKTLQILCVLQARCREGASLVIAPASVVSNWATEMARFTPALRAVVGVTRRQCNLCMQNIAPGDVLIVSYAMLQQQDNLLASYAWNVVVLDEAQYIKNPASTRAVAANSLQAKYRIAATGTPVENHIGDLWSIFQFINPGLLGTYVTFRTRDISAHDYGRLVAPFVLRRTKKELLKDLRDKKEKICYVTLTEQEKSLYECCRSEIETMMSSRDWKKELLPGLQKLRRMCCHPLLGFPDCGLESAKLRHLREMSLKLRKKGHRTLVFSQFTDMLAFVCKMYDNEGIPYCYLDGATPSARRKEVVDSFQRGDADFFVISLKAGGTGLNLTAADTVIILDPWWNPATEEQAADRAHRIGQQRNVTVYRYVCRHTIEEKVLKLKQHKCQLVDSFMAGTSNATGFTLEELRELL